MLQVTQVFYQFFLSLYKARPEFSQTLEHLQATLSSIVDALASVSAGNQIADFSIAASDKFSDIQISHEGFHTYLTELSTKQDTIKFWYQFVFEDCLAYLALYTSIRTLIALIKMVTSLQYLISEPMPVKGTLEFSYTVFNLEVPES